MKDGNILLKIEKESDEEDNSEVRNEKVKKIVKSPKKERVERTRPNPWPPPIATTFSFSSCIYNLLYKILAKP